MARKWLLRWVLFLLIVFSLASLSWASSRFFEVEETDFVRIRAEGYDADDDQLTYTYSLPLNEKGEWQTTYDDAGEYELEIKASDGEKETTEKATLIVRNKNQPPRLTDNRVVVKETQTVDLKILVEDPDDDVLKFTFKEPFDQSGKWATNFNDAGIYRIDFLASDGKFTEEFSVGIEVVNTNKPLSILDTFAGSFLEVAEGKTLAYWVGIEPADGKGEVKYQWKLDAQLISGKQAGEHYFDYNSAGEHFLLLEVSQEGGSREKTEEKIVKEWVIQVMNTNRAPELSFQPVTIKEGEKIVLELPETDMDGDTLSYSMEAPLEKGQWQTNYFSAGEYQLKISVSDGELTGEGILEVTVLNVDRPPSLELPQTIELWEGQEFKLPINTEDPDGDELKITFENLPEGSLFDEKSKVLVLKPDHEIIKRSGRWFSNILNALRLESLMLRKTAIPLKVTGCGAELCSMAEVRLVVNNVNQAPLFEPFLDSNLNVTETLSVWETEEFSLRLKATDPDGDVLDYYYSLPLGRTTGKWKTDYGDAGSYQINVTASDGKLKTTLPVIISILKKNRAPSLKIKKDELTVNEGEEFSFNVEAVDPDQDKLTVSLADYLPGVSFKDGIFEWQPGFEIVANRTPGGWNNLISGSAALNRRFGQDKETVWLNFMADDGEIKTEHPVKVTVKNVNQDPQIIDYMPPQETKVKVGEPVLFHLAVKDLDKDQLESTWSFGFGQGEVKGTDTVKRTFLSAGRKKIEVEVTDGLKEVKHQWSVEVEEIQVPEPVAEEPLSLEPATFRVYVIRS